MKAIPLIIVLLFAAASAEAKERPQEDGTLNCAVIGYFEPDGTSRYMARTWIAPESYDRSTLLSIRETAKQGIADCNKWLQKENKKNEEKKKRRVA